MSKNRDFLRSSILKQLPSLWNYLLLIFVHCILHHYAESRSPPNRNCRDLYTYHKIRNSGNHSIDVDGDGPLTPITVECDMGDGKDPHQILTIVHHNAESITDVRGYEAAGSYVLNISYVEATEAHLMALIDNSFSCQQYIKWACKGSMFGFWYPPDIDSWWVGRNWKKQYYWGGAETDSRSCGCHPYCQKTERNSTCNCDANDKQKWFEDSGLLLDSSRLPVLQLSFGDTGESNEAGQHTLGALMCRAVGHRDVFKGTFQAPVQLTTPGYEHGEYPPPFHRYTWSVKIPEGATMELVFPDYDVVHYGSYNSVPECKNVVTVLAAEDSAGEKHLIVRQKTPPYYASEGSQTTVNITLTTCNQDPRVPLGRGFKAYVRRTECGGCNPGRGKNGDTTYCSGGCGIIASEEYPFPHHFYPFPHHSSEAYNYHHTWILRVFQHYVVELEFSDFDIPAHPGARNCTPDRGVLWIYNGERPSRENLIGGFCNLNRQGKVYSNTNTMTLVFAMRWQKVGNGRGFYAMYKGVVQPITPESAFTKELSNVALGKPAKQSSTLDGRNAELAVDNNTDSTLLSKTCIATKPCSEPWWQVDLQKRYLIYGIEIYSTKLEDQLRTTDSEKTWPTGQYGIPMAVSGCPSSRGFEWKTGYRYQDMNYDIVQDKKIHHWTDGMLLKGGLQKTSVGGVQQKSGVMQYFCMKAQNTTTAETYEWEPGAYCVFQYGENCPAGFHSGSITWSDTRSNRSDSTLYGHTPKGRYTAHTTTIYFCCRTDGNPDIPIKLPTSQPFYLLRYGKSCQKVEGMTETEQFFHYNEDQPRYGPLGKDSLIGGNAKYGFPHPKIDKDLFDRGIALYYCYYDISQSLRGFRVTVDEVGLIWTYGRFHDDLSYGIPHSVEGNFLNAYTCMVYPVTEPEFSVLRVNCSQPIYGQFVTLQVFNRHDSLQFCEMKVFGTESCGQPLGMASEEIYDEQINATSSDDTDHHYYTNGRLNAKSGWCASFNDSNKEFMVDLQNMTTVTGIILQGLNGAQKKVNVKEFYLLFSNDSVSWIWEEEPVGQQKYVFLPVFYKTIGTSTVNKFSITEVTSLLSLSWFAYSHSGACSHTGSFVLNFLDYLNKEVYICEQCESKQYVNDLSVRYNLLKGISTRFVMVKILKYSEEPCLRLEIIGCREKVDCVKNIQMPPFQGVIKSPNHPNYYGQDKSCWWHINPNPGKHIELNFVVYDLAEKEENLLAGDCRDELTVYSGYPNSTAIRSPEGRLFPKRIISNGPLKVHLQSCFRYSLSRYRGFYAYYKSADCPGCGIGDFNCPDVHLCKSKCGEIVSIGHPLPYQNNHRCRWLIEALPSEFINLTFLDFDIVGGETCLHDYLDVYDGNTSLRSNLIGRFCNAKLPPREIVSSWNTLLIEFSSDAEEAGRGFALKYVSQSFQLPVKIFDYDDPLACDPPWKYYEGHCYNAFHENEALQWYEAEAKCKNKAGNQKGHLVSILDKKENAVVHFFLTNFWNAQHKSLYIGLNDELKEGSYRWSDDNPMIYTDWAPAGRSLRTQPDGGAYQDCTMLRVDSGHSTAHWHDIPCSLGKLSFYNWDGIDWGKNDEGDDQPAAGERETLLSVSSYICKMQSERQGGVNQLQQPIPAQIEATGTTPGKVDSLKYYTCRNREMISIQFVCDRKEDCRDGSDEETCPRDSCPVSSFRCANGRCVSIAEYCDFKDDCGDQSDESRCDHRECGADEFQCRNGQCIPKSQVCDLFYNCYDKSDEHECRGICNHNSTFQCYDGTCIPRYTLCDGHRDCPGKYHEDEQYGCSRREDRTGKEEEKNLCSNRARKTCEDLVNLDNIRESGYYHIDPDGLDGDIPPFEVYCDMEDTKYGVKTVIHHDSEDEIYVRSGTDGPGSYTRRIVYSVGMEKVKALTNISKHCHQFVSWKCQGTGFSFDTATPVSWWTSFDGKPQYTWGGAKENATCGCYPNCTDPRRPCNCDSVRRFARSEDSGYLSNKEKLPIREVRFGNTFRTGQSGYHRIGPLECFGNAKETSEVCSNTTNYMRCHTGHYVPVAYRCKYEFDQYQYHIGCRDVTHLRSCENFQCPPDYIKCPESYCIPTRYVCDGKWDCIGGGDEIECDSYNCPGQHKCYGKSNCLPVHQLCDGIRQCAEGDDELFCDIVCPEQCICVGLYVSCMHHNSSSRLPDNIPLDVKKLDFSFNRIDLKTANFSKYKELGELILQYNYLTTLPPKKFIELRNLYKLDLSNNRLTHISALAFEGLKNLRLLHLENNPTIVEIESEAFAGLSNLPSLNLTGMAWKVLRRHTFSGMSRLRYLNLRDNKIKKVEDNSFNSLHSVTVLDIRGNDIVEFSSYIFTGLKSLEYLYSDSFTFCCMALPQVPPANCVPPPDEISSCTDLMSSLVQRSFLWVLGIIALVGNLFVVVWRIKMKDSNRISSTLILSLGFADFLMGVYLIIIASVDVHYRGQYIENSDNWRKSTLCKICGFLSTVSSEVSILTLLSITLDRLICLCFPLSQKRFSLQFTYKLIFISWSIAAVIAIIPLVVEPYFEGRYYARSGVCLALHITSHRATGWEYSVATFFCVNLVAFIAIVAAYTYMYFTIRRSYHNMNRLMARQSTESKIGLQMALIVLTNSLCWFPIILMGLMAMSGMKVSGEAYAWIAVFVLPLNSATNPLIYTVSSLHFYTRMLSRFGLNSKDVRSSYVSKLTNSTARADQRMKEQLDSRPFKPPHGYVPLLQFLRTVPQISPRHLLKIATAVCRTLKELHAGSYALGGIDVNAIFVTEPKEGEEALHVYVPDFNAYKIVNPPINGVPDDTAVDMEEFGLLVKKMLRVYHVMSRSNDPMQGTAC